MKGVGGVIRSFVRLAGLVFVICAGCATVSVMPAQTAVTVGDGSKAVAETTELSSVSDAFSDALVAARLVPAEADARGMRGAWNTLLKGAGAGVGAGGPDAVREPVAYYLNGDEDRGVAVAQRIATDAQALTEIVLDANAMCRGLAENPSGSMANVEAQITRAERILTSGLKARDTLVSALDRVDVDASDPEARSAVGALAALSDSLAILGEQADALARTRAGMVG